MGYCTDYSVSTHTDAVILGHGVKAKQAATKTTVRDF